MSDTNPPGRPLTEDEPLHHMMHVRIGLRLLGKVDEIRGGRSRGYVVRAALKRAVRLAQCGDDEAPDDGHDNGRDDPS